VLVYEAAGLSRDTAISDPLGLVAGLPSITAAVEQDGIGLYGMGVRIRNACFLPRLAC
jgi:hypothetical protein